METDKITIPGWARALAIIGGILSIMAGFLILVFPGLGVLLVAYFLAFALIMLGTERLVVGISAHAYTIKAQKPMPTA
jgi:uncharacterized membrane protein HdeD (DUF308 family)